MEKKDLIIILIIILILTSYYLIKQNNHTELSTMKVIKITDGDTLILENGLKVRLKGINTPETGMLYAKEAKIFLEKTTLEKNVKIRHYGQDKYERLLAYLFIDNMNINQELIKNGLAHSYYYKEDEYYNKIIQAELQARKQKIGIWKKSNNSKCLKLVELDYFDKGNENETLILANTCEKRINITIKDDATHIYKRTIEKGIYTENFQNIFNDNGDSIYIWDKDGLILFYRYS